MTTAINLTIYALAKSRNEAATATLIAAAQSADDAIKQLAVAGLTVRRSKAGHLALLRNWTALQADCGEALQEVRGRMGGALRDALLGDDASLFDNACVAIEQFREFDVLPTLIAIAEHASTQRKRRATQLVQSLVDLLGKLLHAPPEQTDGRDLQQIRANVLESLERSVERFRQHKSEALIEAFVTLAGPSSRTLWSIVDAPHHPCFQTVVNAFTESANPSVIQLLLAFMKQQDAPRIVRNVVSKRADRAFVDALLSQPVDPSNTPVRQNLSRITSFAWQREVGNALLKASDHRQAVAVQLVALSGVPDADAMAFFQQIMRHGSPAARCAVCNALEHTFGDRANQLILHALDDDDGSVQAAAARQLRERSINGAALKLVERLDSPHAEVREAAREALVEFSFENYAARFDTLDEMLRRSTGGLVRRVDPDCIAKLRGELGAPLRSQRRRGIEMAQSMEMITEVADAVAELLVDEDPTIREASAQALQHCTGGEVRAALINALQDTSASVQSAAKESLEAVVAAEQPTAAPPEAAKPAGGRER